MAARTKYNAAYHDDWAWSLAAMGATNKEIRSEPYSAGLKITNLLVRHCLKEKEYQMQR